MNDPRPPDNRPMIFLIVGVSIVAIAFSAYFRPAPSLAAPGLLASDGSVMVQDSRTGLAFIPGTMQGRGLIFYPGARVPPEAYAYLARGLAERGHLCVIARFPLDFAIFASGRAEAIIKAWPSVEAWDLGGHSLGGAMAASWLHSHPASAAGLVLLGSYTTAGASFAGTSLPVLSLSATHDGLATPAKIDAGRKFLPGTARFVVIEGGNHANFGEYGRQDGDGTATIEGERQRSAVVAEVAAFLEAGRWAGPPAARGISRSGR